MRIAKTAVLVALVTVLTSAAAAAQAVSREVLDEPSFCFTAYYNRNLGGGMYQDLKASSLEKSGSQGIGAALMVGASRLISAELDFNLGFHPFGSSDALSGNSLLSVTLDGIVGPSFKAGGGRVRPYLVAGGGFTRGYVGKRRYFGWDGTSKNLGLAEAGGGLMWRFNSWLGARADVRYRFGFGSKEKDGTYGDFFDSWNYLRSYAGVTLTF